MPGAARITLIAGGLLTSLAWTAGRYGLLDGHRSITDILAEVVGVLVIVLAWRYRRHRLGVIALVVAMANLLIRMGHISSSGGDATAVLAILVALDFAILAPARDRPLRSTVGMVWLAIVSAQMWLVGFGLPLSGGTLHSLTDNPTIPMVALAVAGVIVLVAFALRRTSFEASLLWVLSACAIALAFWRGPHPAHLLFAAAQLSLLVGVFEDSYRLAFHDELTGLLGRRALNENMRNLTGQFTIAMIDIDHFKRFNDRHGHDAGDQVLRMVADELAKTAAAGRAYRYGGEEFTILFPGRTVADLRSELDTIRSSIAKRDFALRAPDRPKTKPEKPRKRTRPAKTVKVKVSIGAAGSNSRRSTPEAVLQAADKALYRAKRAGRNRVVAAGDRLRKK